MLTGVGGFIGSHCLRYFLDHTDWHIIGLDSFRHKGTYSRLDDIYADGERVTLLKHDLTVPIDFALESRIMGRELEGNRVIEPGLDYIISMASDSAVERSVSDPGACWRNNCELVYNMLEFARKVKPRIFFRSVPMKSTVIVLRDIPTRSGTQSFRPTPMQPAKPPKKPSLYLTGAASMFRWSLPTA